MKHNLKEVPVQADSHVSEQLEGARSQLERRFSQAGEILASTLNVVSTLIDTVDKLGSIVGAEAVERTNADLDTAAESLRRLPSAQAVRRERLGVVADLGQDLSEQIDSMRLVMRSLRVFALNIKVTAASTRDANSEFSGFAEEMSQRVTLGSAELAYFTEQLEVLGKSLRTALSYEHSLSLDTQRLVPATPDKLAADAVAFSQNQRRIGEIAANVSKLAKGIQTKVVTALTALQIGDITRQRIEHIQAGLVMTASLDVAQDAGDRTRRKVLHLLADQMQDTAECFRLEANRMSASLSGLAGDTSEILRLRDLSAGQGAGSNGLRDLETSISQAKMLIDQVITAELNASNIAASTSETIRQLLDRVEIIRKVQSDIQLMAVNVSLHCSRMGESGKPIAVIAQEISGCAEHLDACADATYSTISKLEAASSLTSEGENLEGGGHALDGAGERLEGAASQTRRGADVEERELPLLAKQGAGVVSALEQTTLHLNLDRDLGGKLSEAADALWAAAGEPVDMIEDIQDQLAPIFEAMSRQYTMAQERAVHSRHAPASLVETTAAANEDQDEDDGLF